MAVGGRPGGMPSKPRVDLAPGTRSDAAAAAVLTQLAAIAEANVPGDARRPRHGVPPRPARRGAARPRGAARAQGRARAGQRAHVRGELKWVQTLTGPVRDLDVQLLKWDDLVAPLPPARAADLEPLRALLQRRRAREFAPAAARPAQRPLHGGAGGLARACATAPAADEERPDAGVASRWSRRTGSGASTAGWCATARRSTTTARRRRCTTCASAARSCATCSSCSAACSIRRSSSRWSRRSRTSRTCSATSRTAPSRATCCARSRTSSPASRAAPRR